MTARLASDLRVAALMRRAQMEGGSAMLLARGDRGAGGILVLLAQRGGIARIMEHGHDLDGASVWRDVAVKVVNGTEDFTDYLSRRKKADGDLWALELDVADSERFAAEMTATG